MKKFVFRLQVVLDIRQKELEKKQLEMAKIAQILNEQLQQKQKLIDDEAITKQELDKALLSEIDIQVISNYKGYLSNILNNIINQEKMIKQTENVLRIKQLEVREAHKQVQILEKLKEKDEAKFYKEFLYQEAKELDDISGTRYRLKAV